MLQIILIAVLGVTIITLLVAIIVLSKDIKLTKRLIKATEEKIIPEYKDTVEEIQDPDEVIRITEEEANKNPREYSFKKKYEPEINPETGKRVSNIERFNKKKKEANK